MLIVDPPRKGLDNGVLSLLLGTHPTSVTRIEYPYLRQLGLKPRDARELISSGYRLKSADGCDIPGSNTWKQSLCLNVLPVRERKGCNKEK